MLSEKVAYFCLFAQNEDYFHQSLFINLVNDILDDIVRLKNDES